VDRLTELRKQLSELLEEGDSIVKRRALGLSDVCTDEEPESNVVMFPYKGKAYVNARQKQVDTAQRRRPYPH